jgi:hypothetical protein
MEMAMTLSWTMMVLAMLLVARRELTMEIWMSILGNADN